MAGLTEKEKKSVNQLKRQLRDRAMGYEESLSFAAGFIQCLKLQGIINKKFAEEMHDNFSADESWVVSDTDCEDLAEFVEKKYGRILF